MTDSILPPNPLDVDQVDFDNAEHRRAFYDALIASGCDKVMEDRRRLYEHKFIDEQGDPIPTFTKPDIVAAGTTRISFFRHGESTGNAGAATSDPVTIPLTERGGHQAEQIARWHWRKPTLIVVSPYGRTRGTAAPLEAHFPDVPVEGIRSFGLPRGGSIRGWLPPRERPVFHALKLDSSAGRRVRAECPSRLLTTGVA